MSIATKCTCGHSLTGVCTSSVKECNQLINMENKCPHCHSTNIRNDSIRNNNGIIGPGCRSWVVEEKYSCNDCGVYFKPVTEKDLNLAIAGHGKPERRGDATSPRWVKGTRNFPVKKPVIAKKFISYLNKEVVGTASSATGEMICFDWGVSSVCLAIGHEELNDLYWLDEQPAAGREEDAVAFLAWIQKNDYYYSTHGGGYWYEWNEKEQETYLCNTNDELYKLFKKENP